MLRVNINSMSDMELTEHITAFLEEREKKDEKEQEKRRGKKSLTPSKITVITSVRLL